MPSRDVTGTQTGRVCTEQIATPRAACDPAPKVVQTHKYSTSTLPHNHLSTAILSNAHPPHFLPQLAHAERIRPEIFRNLVEFLLEDLI